METVRSFIVFGGGGVVKNWSLPILEILCAGHWHSTLWQNSKKSTWTTSSRERLKRSETFESFWERLHAWSLSKQGHIFLQLRWPMKQNLYTDEFIFFMHYHVSYAPCQVRIQVFDNKLPLESHCPMYRLRALYRSVIWDWELPSLWRVMTTII